MKVAALGFEPVDRPRSMVQVPRSEPKASEDQKIRDDTQPAHWLAQARSGDRDAYGRLVRYHEPDVLRLCQRLLGSAAESEDACQESFARAHSAIASSQRRNGRAGS